MCIRDRFYIALFLIGIYIVNKTFILPIPLNESGMLLIGGDNSIELKDMFILVPFRTLIDYYQYINIGEYFLSLSDFFAGSFLIGFSVVRIFDGKTHIQRITVIRCV